MAVNLGEVNFRLGADTSSLSAAVKNLQEFGDTAKQAAASMSLSARASAGANQNVRNQLVEQQKAAVESLRAVLNLNNRMRTADYGVEQVHKTNEAWKEYATTLTSGKLNQEQFLASQTQFKNTMADVTREFSNSGKAGKLMFESEKASADSLRSIQAMSVKMQGTPFGDEQVTKLNTAWQAYNNTLTNSKLTTLDMGQAQIQFKNSVAQVSREFALARKAGMLGAEGPNKFAEGLRGIAKVSQLVTGPLSGISYRLSNLASIAEVSGLKMLALYAGILAGVYIFMRFGDAIIHAGAQYEGYRMAMVGVTGSQEAANYQLNQVHKIAKTAGQSIQALVPEYTKWLAAIKGTALEGAKGQQVFTSMAKVASALQLPVQESAGSFKALEQMVSKGVVQAEELRGQLGDRLPGAFQIAARSMNVSTAELQKMMKAGKLVTTDFLPRFAVEMEKTYGTTNLKKIDTFMAAQNNMNNSFYDFFVRLNEISHASDKVKNVMNGVASAMEWVTAHAEILLKVLAVLASSFAGLVASRVISGLALLASGFLSTARAALTLNTVMSLSGFISIVQLAAMAATTLIMFKGSIDDTLMPLALMQSGLQALATFLGNGYIPAIIAATSFVLLLAKAFDIVRLALIRTGFGILIVLIGEIVAKLVEASEHLGGFGKVMKIISELAKGVWTAIGFAIASMIAGTKSLWYSLMGVIYKILGNIQGFAQAVWNKMTIGAGLMATAMNIAWVNVKIAFYSLLDGITSKWGQFLTTLGVTLGVVASLGVFGPAGSKAVASIEAQAKAVEGFKSEISSAQTELSGLQTTLKAGQVELRSPFKPIINDLTIMADMANTQATAYGHLSDYLNTQANSPIAAWSDLQAAIRGPMGPPPKPFTYIPPNGSGSGSGTGSGGAGTSKQSEALKKFNEQLSDVMANIALLGAAPAKVKELERAFEIAKTVRTASDALEKAGYSAAFVAQKAEELRNALAHENSMKDWADRVRGGFQDMQNVAGNALDSFTSNLINDVNQGKKALDSLANTARTVAMDILNTLLKLTVSNPLKNWLFGMNENTLEGGLGGKGGGGIFKQLFSAATSLFSGGAVQSGGMAPQVSAKSSLAMPSARASSAAAPPAQITINNNAGAQVEHKQTKGANGQDIHEFIISAVQKGIAEGKLDNTMGSAFNVQRGIKKR